MAKICKESCNSLITCQLLPLSPPLQICSMNCFKKRLLILYAWAARGSWDRATSGCTHMNHLLSLNRLFFFLIPTHGTHRPCLDPQGLLRVNIADLSYSVVFSWCPIYSNSILYIIFYAFSTINNDWPSLLIAFCQQSVQVVVYC